jgi:hypothetical protein
VTPVDVGWEPTPVNIGNVEEGGTVYRLPFTNDRFRRSSACVLAGSYSLFCGLSAAEANARNYLAAAGGGYGPNWYETIEHPFRYSGSGSVTFQYVYDYETEPGYDFALAIVEVNGSESVLAAYTGTGGGTANINITPYLGPLSGTGGEFTLKFRVTSDFSFDDADGAYPTTCGALIVDNVTVQGGGVNYTSGFETLADGWYQDPAENPVTEYWLVENRRRIGYDDNLHGQGLLVWHVEDEILNAPLLQNDGKAGGVRGLALEEADGLVNMIGSNFGNGGDPYPGTASNTAFTGASNPGSNDNTQRPTQIQVTSIGATASTVPATLRAGDPGPSASDAIPTQLDNNQTAAVLTIVGSGMRAGATIALIYEAPGEGSAAAQEVAATSLEWLDATRVRGTLNLYGRPGGSWDARVTNPDGQSFVLADAVTINFIVATQLHAAFVDVIGEVVRLRYQIGGREPGETVRLSRSNHDARVWTVIEENLLPVRGDEYEFTDRDVVAGHTYHYLLESVDADGSVRELHRATATTPARALVLEQNRPNPFNPGTSIRFYLPSKSPVRLDVFDIRGALVRRLADGTFDAGPHVREWDGTDDDGRPVASGVYVYRLTADRKSMTRKMMLLK